MKRLRRRRARLYGPYASVDLASSFPAQRAGERRNSLKPLWAFWRSRIARHAPANHLQKILATRSRLQLEGSRGGGSGYGDPAVVIGSVHQSLTALRGF